MINLQLLHTRRLQVSSHG